MKNESKLADLFWPLVFSLLLVVTAKSHRSCSPGRSQSLDQEQEPDPQPIPLVVAHSTATNSAATTEVYHPAVPRWKGLLQTVGVVTAVGLLVLNLSQTYATLRATQQASYAARSTAEATARQLELSQRPWISIDTSVVSPLTFTPEGAAQVTLTFSIRNVGSTPAKGLSVQPEMYIASLGEQDPVMERSKVCEENRSRGTGMDGTLFPKVELTKSVTFHGGAKDIVEESNRTGSFAPAVIVCASYRSTFDDSARYTTGVIYFLRRIDPSQPGLYLRMKNGVEVPRDFLALNYDPIGAIAAN